MPTPNLPPQFVCALFLVIFFIRLARRDEGSPSRIFLAMIAVYALQSTLHGLRWGYGIEIFRPLQPILASIIPPLTWLGFASFTTGARRWWLHALPPVVVVLLLFASPILMRPVLFLIAAGYGVALLLLARSGPDALDRVELDGTLTVYRATLVTGVNLILSAFVDLAITYDIVRNNGAHAAWIAGMAGVAIIAVLGWTAVAAGDSAPARTEDKPAPVSAPAASPVEPEPEDSQVIATLDALMETTRLYRDPELSLDRIARRMLIPARRISGAVNRVRAINVSQYVNAFRIADACVRLSASDASITQIMFEVGFQTKSNFNREFLRVTGQSPTAWRAAQKATQPA